MKIIIVVSIVSVASLLAFFGIRYFGSAQKPEGARSIDPIYDLSYTSIDGTTVRLDAYRGKFLLIVNVASECGFTPQYEELEKLYRENRENLVVIGFPSNDFGGQEPGTNEQISIFCQTNYNVTFPLSQKIRVIGEEKHPVYAWLTDRRSNGWNDAEPKWNFNKYLVDSSGELVGVYPSTTKPLSPEIVSRIH